MNVKINKQFYMVIVLIMAGPIIGSPGLDLNQVAPSFSLEPVDQEIAANDSLSLEWQISSFENSEYNIFMEYEDNSTLVGEGDVTSSSVTLELDSLPIGDFLFAFHLIHSAGSSWSNITITVSGSTDEGGDSGSDDGFLPGFPIWLTNISIVSLVGIINLKRKNLS